MLLASRARADALEAAPALREWLAGLGADAEMTTMFDRALVSPPALGIVFDEAQSQDMAAYLYVAAVVAADPRFRASLLLGDLVQARFDLPSAVARSAARRYQR